MLDGVHRPTALGVAKGIDAVAAKCGGIEYLGAGIVVVRLVKHNPHVLHQRLHRSLHEGIVHHDMLTAEVLLHDMVDAVGNSRESLLHGKCECIGGVDERHGREHQRREIGEFVVGLGARDHASRVILRACGCQCDDIHNGYGLESGSLARHDVPRVGVRTRCSGYCLGAVEHTASAY